MGGRLSGEQGRGAEAFKKSRKGGKCERSPSKNKEREVLRGRRYGFWGWGSGERLGGEAVRRYPSGGDCVCLEGRKKKEGRTEFGVCPPRVRGKREAETGKTRLRDDSG